VVKLWRLAIPACFGAVVAFMLLAGVFEATLESDAEWLVAAAAGIVVGRMRGWSLVDCNIYFRSIMRHVLGPGFEYGRAPSAIGADARSGGASLSGEARAAHPDAG
jgi:hypothetical protein